LISKVVGKRLYAMCTPHNLKTLKTSI